MTPEDQPATKRDLREALDRAVLSITSAVTSLRLAALGREAEDTSRRLANLDRSTSIAALEARVARLEAAADPSAHPPTRT